jgi:hypothetical protein
MTRKELELMICALEMYYEMELNSDALDLKDKSDLIHRISELRLKVYKKLRDKLSPKHID